MLCLFCNFKYVHLAFYANQCSFFSYNCYISSANYQDINFYLLFIVLHLIKYEISGCPIQKFLQGERQLQNSKQLDKKIPIPPLFLVSRFYCYLLTILFLDILLHKNLKLTKNIIQYFCKILQGERQLWSSKQFHEKIPIVPPCFSCF